jgi:hypothetical protein
MCCCVIKTDSECDFGSDISYQIEFFLNLRGAGYPSYKNWESNDRFLNIVKGIAKSSLKNSLKELGVYCSDITLVKAQEILNENDCSHIIATDKDPGPQS